MLYDRWGGPEVVRLAEIEKPAPADGEVVVRVVASSINSWDYDLMIGKRYLVRPPGFASGPKQLGFDVAGTVEAVGSGVTQFKPGDAVFGDMAFDGPRAFADYVAVREGALAIKPDAVSFVQAAALAQAGLLAALALGGEPRIASGSNVLVNGGGGGVGPIAIQLARLAGARVTGVDSARKIEAMRAAGADETLDYAETDFTRTGRRYDRIVDVVANRPMRDFARALAPGGRLAIVGGSPGSLLRAVTVGTLLGLVTGRRMGLVIHKVDVAELERLAGLCAAGQLAPAIDSVHGLENIRAALERFASGQFTGKIVIRVADGPA